MRPVSPHKSPRKNLESGPVADCLDYIHKTVNWLNNQSGHTSTSRLRLYVLAFVLLFGGYCLYLLCSFYRP